MKLGDGTDVSANGLTGRLYLSAAAPGQERGSSKPRSSQPGSSQQEFGNAERPSKTGGQVFVLLHGIGVSHRYLARLHLELASGRQARDAVVYSFDLPGFGDTPRPGRQVSVGEYAAFVAAVLADAGVQSCVVVGHSMGVQFAVELALQEPDLVSRVVLMGPVVDPARRSAAWHALALTRDALLSESPSTNLVVFGDYFKAGLRWYLTELPVMLAYPLETRVCGVDQPVLVLRGSRDPIARRPWCEFLASQAQHGTFVDVLGRGHVVQDSAPEAVAQAIVHWASTAADDVTA
ncbi:alpha/beta fold hydrolase [Arthrobacter sp. ISL-28]|uniref:alpha/beta fold hydrolase n=1 Tax=Arthrobacter sp. ISL-28 TaxID=2819108 RepID=UPI001BE9E04D|nr:alpha/beta hydrolase [Arthrobacter sp. ISL-28]MBT2522223.1 alpha/beta hydrolase [Arthrobacter sp. ISL-28]